LMGPTHGISVAHGNTAGAGIPSSGKNEDCLIKIKVISVVGVFFLQEVN